MQKLNTNIYTKVLLHEKISVNFKDINNNIYNLLQNLIKNKIEGVCINEGFVKPDSVNLISYSSGEIYSNNALFHIIYECLITNPPESMVLNCSVKSITKVGIRAELNQEISPFVVFIARDHHYNNDVFSTISEGDIINVRVVGQRFELNDKFISIIAELVDINNYEKSKSEMIKSNETSIGSKIRLKLNKK